MHRLVSLSQGQCHEYVQGILHLLYPPNLVCFREERAKLIGAKGDIGMQVYTVTGSL